MRGFCQGEAPKTVFILNSISKLRLYKVHFLRMLCFEMCVILRFKWIGPVRDLRRSIPSPRSQFSFVNDGKRQDRSCDLFCFGITAPKIWKRAKYERVAKRSGGN